MIEQEKWFSRKFELGRSPALLPGIVERLRGTPDRLVERASGLSTTVLTSRIDGKWSVQEHAGHLLDLEPLWMARVEQLFAKATELDAADLSNRATEEAQHNERALAEILNAFRASRAELVRRIEAADDATSTHAALHPRLKEPMRLVDHAFFVAEHDDHHLAAITHLRSQIGEQV